MIVRSRLSPDETRERIVIVAEEQFRRLGYAKTTVADIASALDMSPANVYRFFASKSEINDAICRRMMDGCHALCETIIAGPGSASERLSDLVLAVHRRNKALLTSERRIHDMVAVAMEENWGAIEAHIATMEQLLSRLIADGIASGEFDPTLDPAKTALTVFDACLVVFHPTMIAQCGDKDQEPQAREIAAFILRALRA